MTKQIPKYIYAGDLAPYSRESLPFIGLSLTQENTYHIKCDVSGPLPFEDESIEIYQSEDVFEHLPYEKMPFVLSEAARVLKPGGLLRMSMPDYRCNVLKKRCVMEDDKIVFDPGGGGAYVEGKVVDGGHQWFPVIETVANLIIKHGKAFKTVDYLQHYTVWGEPHLLPIDHGKGRVNRTPDYDNRVKQPRRPLSIVVDLYK